MSERDNNGIVSFESEELILVDEHDNEIGTMSKALCHDGDGVLHRAFSAFVFNSNGELLLQKRAAGKRLWPGYWSNSCCSHPRAGESLETALERRLVQELGFALPLTFVYRFAYHARFGQAGSERELCSVYVGTSDQPVRANPTEIAEWRYVAPDALDRELETGPDRFTPWFRLEWAALGSTYADVVDEALAR